MPLRPGKDRKTIGANIREMIAAGHSQPQAVAAALRTADESGKPKRKSLRDRAREAVAKRKGCNA